MFKILFDVLPESSTLNLTIMKKDNEFTVMVSTTDVLKKVIPMTIKGTPEELDKEFANTIGEALAQTKGLATQLQQYQEKLKAKTKEVEDKLKEKKPITGKTPKAAKKDDDDTGGGMFESEKKEEKSEENEEDADS